METERIDAHLTARIVRNYVKHHRVGTGEIADLITSIHQALGKLGQPVQPEEVRTPAVPVRRSVHQEYVICLDCGYRGKTLRRHINSQHGLSRDEYLKRWGLRSDHPLTAPAYSERRSSLAKALGLGRKPKAQETSAPAAAAMPAPPDADPKPEAKPTRRRRSRALPKPEDVASEAAPARPARKRRSRSGVNSPQPE